MKPMLSPLDTAPVFSDLTSATGCYDRWFFHQSTICAVIDRACSSEGLDQTAHDNAPAAAYFCSEQLHAATYETRHSQAVTANT
jgi:hypothetical protein